MDNKPERYNHSEAEKKWRDFWEKEEVYKFDKNSDKVIYSIDTPPPTVSGKMHIGHAFSYSQQDFVARFHRMRGENVFYPFGTDDNGLPTERLVEKLKGVKGSRMPRHEFVKLCYETLKEVLPNFVQDWKNLGISCDWNIYYSTINEHCQRISQRSFIQLYKQGREYQKQAPTIWCPECQTAISQVEMKDKELSSTFNDIIFKVDGKDVIIATTRPELLASCNAVFAHPTDERYKSLFGKKAKVPLFNHEVPIMPDERADPAKGTGIVMCCTFGDQTDMEWYKAYNLSLRISITKDGRMTEITGKYQGMKIHEARKAIIEDLKANNLLINQKPITHVVQVHERCSVELEILETKQWFVKYLDLKKKLLSQGKKLNWYPDHMKHRYNNWVNGLQWDWCISRQRFFGIPFPVWYCKKCSEVKFAEEDELPVDPLNSSPKTPCKCGSNDFEPEKDVLDTWATSSLTPQLAIELIKESTLAKKLFPMSLRPQAHDIITFWLFNTVVKSMLHENNIPWKDVMISGFVTMEGEKMSKSKGNVIEPQVVLQKYSADALRYWAAGSRLGEDLDYMEKDLVTGEKTITKLWNACRFTFMHLNDFDNKTPERFEAYDLAILSKFNKIINACTETFDNYEYSKTRQEVDNFFWHDLCDNYLEIVKDRLYNYEKRGVESRKSAQYTLYYLMINTVKMFAPIMPYITEELYQTYFKKYENEKSIHITSWPVYDKSKVSKKNDSIAEMVHFVVSAARKFKTEKQLSLKVPLKKIVVKTKLSKKDFELVKLDILGATLSSELIYEKLAKEEKENNQVIIEN